MLDRPVDRFLVSRAMGDVRIEVSGAQGDALFAELGPAEVVEEYLADVPVDHVREVEVGAPIAYERRDSGRRPAPQQAEDL